MTTNYHTAIALGAAANAATINTPLGTIDAQVTALTALDGPKVSKIYESDGGGPAASASADGNLMVGTTTNITGAKLQVNGSKVGE